MKQASAIRHNHSSLLRPITRSALLSASFSTLEGPRTDPAGFVSALVHEIRNPLCTISLALEMLSTTGLDDEQKHYLGMIARGSGRIKELVSRLLLLDLTKEADNEAYPLHQLLEEVLAGVGDRMLLRNVSVRREYTAPEHRVFLDREKMKIALTNIVINAIEAMSSGTRELKLVTKSTDEESFIEIHDTGTGISRGDLKRIFEPHFSGKPGGMGIGLSAALDILRANHTRVNVRSEEGVGTCFVLSFDRMCRSGSGGLL